MKINILEILTWAKEAGYSFDFYGNKNDTIIGFSSLKHYKDKTITWIKKQISIDTTLENSIQLAVIQRDVNLNIKNKIISDHSKQLFFDILSHFFVSKEKKTPIGQGTFIGNNVTLENDVVIGCNCTLDGKICVGARTVIEHNVVIMNSVTIGEDCIIHSGTIIGKDGFGFSFDENNIPQKVTHFGGVRIGDRVEIGAHCVIDRGTIDDTVVGNDVKMDSGSGVAHNAEVGTGTLLVGAGLGGSSKVGEKSYLAPRSWIQNQQSVGNNTLISIGVVVAKAVGDNCIVTNKHKKSVPTDNYREWL